MKNIKIFTLAFLLAIPYPTKSDNDALIAGGIIASAIALGGGIFYWMYKLDRKDFVERILRESKDTLKTTEGIVASLSPYKKQYEAEPNESTLQKLAEYFNRSSGFSAEYGYICRLQRNLTDNIKNLSAIKSSETTENLMQLITRSNNAHDNLNKIVQVIREHQAFFTTDELIRTIAKKYERELQAGIVSELIKLAILHGSRQGAYPVGIIYYQEELSHDTACVQNASLSSYCYPQLTSILARLKQQMFDINQAITTSEIILHAQVAYRQYLIEQRQLQQERERIEIERQKADAQQRQAAAKEEANRIEREKARIEREKLELERQKQREAQQTQSAGVHVNINVPR